jgi:hypothetical protein
MPGLYGVVAAYAFGLLMNLSGWPFLSLTMAPPSGVAIGTCLVDYLVSVITLVVVCFRSADRPSTHWPAYRLLTVPVMCGLVIAEGWKGRFGSDICSMSAEGI